MRQPVNVALIGGPMYDRLYDGLAHLSETERVQVHIGFRADLYGIISPEETADFIAGDLSLAKIADRIHGLPRNVDVRLLHYRTDLLSLARTVSRPPSLYGFVFPGKRSGLFGTIFELLQMGGAQLFPPGLAPDILNDHGRWALGLLRTL